MKRFTTNWTLVLMAVLSFSLMSCQDDDERLAYNLDGVWQGTIETDNQTYSTTICFFQDGYYASHGYGYEYDSGWSYGRTTRTNFEWWVSGGYIYDLNGRSIPQSSFLKSSNRRGIFIRNNTKFLK